jgi:hypothetical protein
MAARCPAAREAFALQMRTRARAGAVAAGFASARRPLRRIAAAWLRGLVLAGLAASVTARDSLPLFESDETLHLTIEAPWSALRRERGEPQRHPAVIHLEQAEGERQRIDATIEVRGLTRRSVCRFPPLRLRFAREATRGTVFDGQRELKLVTHCRNGVRHEQYYVQELLAYRIYRRVSEHGFRARPLQVRYADVAGGEADGPRFAFAIEDLRELARRSGLRRAPEARFAPGDYEARMLGRFMLFQYLIGNTDWDVLAGPEADACCHNVRVIGSDDPRVRIPVPYDFDSAGMVDAQYAAPHAKLPIQFVTQRLFRGFCRHNAALPAARADLLGQRGAILDLVRSETRLGAARRRVLERWFEEFFAILASDPRFAREITGQCRK